MPNMTGSELLGQIDQASRLQNLPVVLFSSSMRRCHMLNELRYTLEKPSSVDSILAVIESALKI